MSTVASRPVSRVAKASGRPVGRNLIRETLDASRSLSTGTAEVDGDGQLMAQLGLRVCSDATSLRLARSAFMAGGYILKSDSVRSFF